MNCVCEACHYSWWPNEKPVNMDDSERTLSNGGMGECRYHSPEAPLDRSRYFPIIMPLDYCGNFLMKSQAMNEKEKQSHEGEIIVLHCDFHNGDSTVPRMRKLVLELFEQIEAEGLYDCRMQRHGLNTTLLIRQEDKMVD